MEGVEEIINMCKEEIELIDRCVERQINLIAESIREKEIKRRIKNSRRKKYGKKNDFRRKWSK